MNPENGEDRREAAKIDGWAISELPHQRLRRMLDTAQLSNADVAEWTGAREETVSRWKTGAQEPDERYMAALIQLLKTRDVRVTVEWMRFGTVPIEPKPDDRVPQPLARSGLSGRTASAQTGTDPVHGPKDKQSRVRRPSGK